MLFFGPMTLNGNGAEVPWPVVTVTLRTPPAARLSISISKMIVASLLSRIVVLIPAPKFTFVAPDNNEPLM